MVVDGVWDDARNFRCQYCETGVLSWNCNSSRLYTRCDNADCGRYPTSQNQAKLISIEKKLSVFLLENTGDIDVSALKMRAKIPDSDDGKDDEKGGGDEKSKLSDELKGLLNEGQKYLKKHYLLIALYHRLCQVNLHIRWLRLRYESMMDIYKDPNDCLLRACMEYHRFIPLLAVGDMMTGNIKKSDNNKMIKLNKHQTEMDELQEKMEYIQVALDLKNN